VSGARLLGTDRPVHCRFPANINFIINNIPSRAFPHHPFLLLAALPFQAVLIVSLRYTRRLQEVPGAKRVVLLELLTLVSGSHRFSVKEGTQIRWDVYC